MPRGFTLTVPIALRNLWRVRLGARLVGLGALIMRSRVEVQSVPAAQIAAAPPSWSPPFDAWADPDELRDVPRGRPLKEADMPMNPPPRGPMPTASAAPPPRRRPPAMTLAVGRCARCGADHRAVEFREFATRPDRDTSHWGTCPATGEPILLTIRP